MKDVILVLVPINVSRINVCDTVDFTAHFNK